MALTLDRSDILVQWIRLLTLESTGGWTSYPLVLTPLSPPRPVMWELLTTVRLFVRQVLVSLGVL